MVNENRYKRNLIRLGIIFITESNGRGLINQATTNWILMRNQKQTLSKIIIYFKAKTSTLIHNDSFIYSKWQHNYYEHIIRNEKELNRIREYIYYNPLKWDLDIENPDTLKDVNKVNFQKERE